MSTLYLFDYSGSQDSLTPLLASNVGSSLIPSDVIASALQGVNDRLHQLALDPNGLGLLYTTIVSYFGKDPNFFIKVDNLFHHN
jgi:hypothetical protein